MRAPRVLLVDCFDSFVGMLYQMVGRAGAEAVLRRSDTVTPETVREVGATHLLLSPGPKTPADTPVAVELVREFAGTLPVLGVCLGHQAIGAAFGAEVVPARELVHGKVSEIHHDGAGVLRGVPSPFPAARYHSLALDRGTLPPDLLVHAWTEDGEVMAIRREGGPTLAGLQFHPESVLTDHGGTILGNFLGRAE